MLAGMTGVGLGFMLSAPQTLPLIDYLRSSLRVAHRTEAAEETPAGPQALIQLVLPYAFGSSQRGSTYIGGVGENRIESAAGGYAGLITALVFAPLGWADPRRRRQLMFWAAVFVIAMTPTTGIPLLRLFFRIRPVSLLRNNRLVFVAGFALLAAGAIGLDVWLRNPGLYQLRAGKRCIGLGAALVTAIGVSFAVRGAQSNPAAPGGFPWRAIASHPAALFWPDAWSEATANDPNGWFGMMSLNAVVLCVVAGGALLALSRAARRLSADEQRETGRHPWPFLALPSVLVAMAIAEMVSMAAGVNVQSDPWLYYPRLQWMDRVAASPGRICGVDCLPANLNLAHRFPDIRGYDAADPVPLVELLVLAQKSPQFDLTGLRRVAQTLDIDPVAPGPVADLLNVRYLVGRGDPPAGVNTIYRGQDYWLAENPNALPRATIPHSIKLVQDRSARLRELAAPSHDPAQVALLESEPAGGVPAGLGRVTIVEDHPNRVRLESDLNRGGLVRLADAYDPGCARPATVARHKCFALTTPCAA